MSESNALPLVLLTEQFAKLPGIGMKSAQRLAYHVMSMSEQDAKAFADAIANIHSRVHLCKRCQNFTDKDICPVCASSKRDHSLVCVVESPKDISAFEGSREVNGVYHVLHGLLSPMENIGPQDIKITELLKRIESEGITEVIMATNPTVEGESTAMYISKLLKPLGVKVTRLAVGLPFGSSLDYDDKETLNEAIKNRTTEY